MPDSPTSDLTIPIDRARYWCFLKATFTTVSDQLVEVMAERESKLDKLTNRVIQTGMTNMQADICGTVDRAMAKGFDAAGLEKVISSLERSIASVRFVLALALES